MAVLTLESTFQFALEILQRREQHNGTVVSVIMGFFGYDLSPKGARAGCAPELEPDFFLSRTGPTPLSGGAKYHPMTSQNFSSTGGSFDTLKVRVR